MTASTLMRFTSAASIMLIVGLVVAEPASGSRWGLNLDALRHPRDWYRSRGTKAEVA
jgi:hypothetical protein